MLWQDLRQYLDRLGELGDLKRVKGELTYIGFAVTLKGQVAAAEVFVPAGAITVGAQMLAPVFRPVE